MSFYVRSKTGVTWQVWETCYTNGQRSQEKVPVDVYRELGFNVKMSLAEARARAVELNLSKSRDKKAATKAARRSVDITLVKSLFVPENLSKEFYERLKEESFSTEKYTKKLLSHWQYVQRMLSELQIEPVEYADRAKAFYKYFMEHKTSLDYVRKLLRIINLWGAFVCKHRGQFYEPVALPKGHIKERIHEAYQSSPSYRGEAEALTEELLTKSKSKWKVPGNYEWMFVSLWFGLRPSELEAKRRVEGKHLWVYQAKLSSLPEAKRWKVIPILYPEQAEALEYLVDAKVRKPLAKTIKKVLGEGFGLYSGRKGFFDLMRSRDHSLEKISAWMGHTNIQRTWEKYRNRQRTG